MDEFGEITQVESERLSVIKYQLDVAREQSKSPAPLNSFSMNTMQDATESLLSLVADHVRAPLGKKQDFISIFDAVMEKIGESDLTGFRASMLAMNTARVNFKHHGNVPAETTIRRHLDRVEEFAQSLIKAVFDVDLRDVSLTLFVRCEEARVKLESAQSSWIAGDSSSALRDLRISFDELVRDYEKRKVWYPGRSLFSTKPNFLPSKREQKKAGKTVEKLFEWMENVDDWVKNLSLGIDMRRYAYFDAHTPRISRMLSGAIHVHLAEGVDVTEESFQRCFKFVLDTALSFAADDFDFDLWAARRALDS